MKCLSIESCAPSSSIHITVIALPLHFISTLHNMTHSHVPKFGNWESDSIPYTVYFENAVARNKKVLINPNDPEENPEAFNLYIRGVVKTSDEAVKGSTTTRVSSNSSSSLEQISHEEEEGRSNNTKSNSQQTAESGNETSNSDYSVIQRVKSSLKESISAGASFIGGRSHSLNENVNHEGAIVPEFGAWNVTDPKSGEGYSAIFSEIRKQKQNASSRSEPRKTLSLNNRSNIQNQCGTPSSILSKCCCCLFSSESK